MMPDTQMSISRVRLSAVLNLASSYLNGESGTFSTICWHIQLSAMNSLDLQSRYVLRNEQVDYFT